MSKNTFEDIYKSVQGLEAGSIITFNGFPMVVESQTTTYDRYYGECRWVNQLDGKLQMDVTLRAVIKFDSEVTRLKAEAERFRVASLQGDAARVENTHLKAEVERLNAENERLSHFGGHETRRADAMKAEVVRSSIQYNNIIDTQLATIEGLKDEVTLMNQLFEKHLTPKIRKAIADEVRKVLKQKGLKR